MGKCTQNFKTPKQVCITDLYKITLETHTPKPNIPAGNYMFKVNI